MYAYDAAGQLTRVTSPDGSYLQYPYDAAHRLTQINDDLGNRIVYTFDNNGNRLNEAHYRRRVITELQPELARFVQFINSRLEPKRRCNVDIGYCYACRCSARLGELATYFHNFLTQCQGS